MHEARQFEKVQFDTCGIIGVLEVVISWSAFVASEILQWANVLCALPL
jgi:hypothetical protein